MSNTGKAIEQAAKYAGAKAKPRMKNGTRDYAAPRSSVSLSQPRWDMGATGPANRVRLIPEDRGFYDAKTGKMLNPNDIKGVRRVDMLEVYHKRGWISYRGYAAGEALRDAWEATQRGKGVDMSDVRVDRTPKPGAAIDIQIDRVSRLISVSELVAPDDMGIVFAVACEGHAISSIKRYRGRHHEQGKVHLREALDRLADAIGG